MKSKGMIVCGYPGIGKSSIAGQYILNKDELPMYVIDLESTNMKVEGWTRPDHWYKIYVNYAIDLMNQGYCVMCSTHSNIRKELEDRGVEYVNVMPTENVQDYWLCRLRDRWKKDPIEKNELAYNRAMEYYKEDILNLKTHNKYCQINIEEGYDLRHILDMYIMIRKDKWVYN